MVVGTTIVYFTPDIIPIEHTYAWPIWLNTGWLSFAVYLYSKKLFLQKTKTPALWLTFGADAGMFCVLTAYMAQRIQLIIDTIYHPTTDMYDSSSDVSLYGFCIQSVVWMFVVYLLIHDVKSLARELSHKDQEKV